MTVLLKHMPHESAFVRAVVGGPHWTQMDALLLIGDLLAGANWQRVGDPNLARPEPLPRPGDERRQDDEDAKWSALMEAQVAALNGKGTA